SLYSLVLLAAIGLFASSVGSATVFAAVPVHSATTNSHEDPRAAPHDLRRLSPGPAQHRHPLRRHPDDRPGGRHAPVAPDPRGRRHPALASRPRGRAVGRLLPPP